MCDADGAAWAGAKRSFALDYAVYMTQLASNLRLYPYPTHIRSLKFASRHVASNQCPTHMVVSSSTQIINFVLVSRIGNGRDLARVL